MSDKKRTITLSGRPPVSISDANWPMLASASDKTFDGEYESQANRVRSYFVAVRQHEDGRAIVYATYSYDTRWQGERGESRKCGRLLPAGSDTDSIVSAIESVCSEIAGECDDDTWSRLAAECVADMPAEELE